MKKILVLSKELSTERKADLSRLLPQHSLEFLAYSRLESTSVRNNGYSAVIMDNTLSETESSDGLGIVKRIFNLPIIMLSKEDSPQSIISSISHGAHACISPRYMEKDLAQKLDSALNAYHSLEKVISIPKFNQPLGDLIGSGRQMQHIYHQIGEIANVPVPVLIRGETGTGKEVVARTIWNYGFNGSQPFVIVQCNPETLLEDELFGHNKGAYTNAFCDYKGALERANNGILFLDEIGDISLEAQMKLLRAVENKTFRRLGSGQEYTTNARIISSTNQPLEKLIKQKMFRSDLYHRLNITSITIPALREHPEDIAELALFFIYHHSKKCARHVEGITSDALHYLTAYSWPGNIRQLENTIRRVVAKAKRPFLSKSSFEEALTNPLGGAQNDTKALMESEEYYFRNALEKKLVSLMHSLEPEEKTFTIKEFFEKEVYAAALRYAKYNHSKTARILGVSRPTVREYIRKFGLLDRESNNFEIY